MGLVLDSFYEPHCLWCGKILPEGEFDRPVIRDHNGGNPRVATFCDVYSEGPEDDGCFSRWWNYQEEMSPRWA